jgi:hypothetical protein
MSDAARVRGGQHRAFHEACPQHARRGQSRASAAPGGACGFRRPFLETTDQPRVLLDGQTSRAPPRGSSVNGAESRADLDHLVVRSQGSQAHHARVVAVVRKVLTSIW